jgi:hypothetical protein
VQGVQRKTPYTDIITQLNAPQASKNGSHLLDNLRVVLYWNQEVEQGNYASSARHAQAQGLYTTTQEAGNNPRDQCDEHLSEGRSGTSSMAA